MGVRRRSAPDLDRHRGQASRTARTITTDGPFAESKEQLGGFWVIQCADLDAALEWAGKASVACKSPVEVRPFQDDAG